MPAPGSGGSDRARRRGAREPQDGVGAAWLRGRRARCSSRRPATCRKRSTWLRSWPAKGARRGARPFRPSLPTSWRGPRGSRSASSGSSRRGTFPVAIPSWKVFPALLAGNGIVIKPSEHAPACCEAFVAACLEAGVPDGLVQVVHGFVEPAAALAVHPAVGAVSFTGSVPAGRCRRGAGDGGRTEARVSRARRQERDDRAARRRSRPRRRRRHVRCVRHRRAAVHVDVEVDRPSRSRLRARRAHRRASAGVASRRSGRTGDRHGPRDHR